MVAKYFNLLPKIHFMVISIEKDKKLQIRTQKIKRQQEWYVVFLYAYLFQVLYEKNASTGIISNLPAIILKQSRSFVGIFRLQKLSTGPITPSPGPTLLSEVLAALNALCISNPKDVSSIVVVKNKNAYIIKYDEVLRITLSSITFESIVGMEVQFGCTAFCKDNLNCLNKIITLDIFSPPAVEPAQEPNIIKSIRIACEN